MSRPRRSERSPDAGITLVELLVVIGVLGIALTAGFMFFVGALKRTGETEERRNALADQRIALERLARDARQASGVVEPAPGESGNLLVLTRLGGGEVSYDCGTTPGACSRAAGGQAELLIDGLDPEAPPIFSAAASRRFVEARIRVIPGDRSAPIALDRGIALRNVPRSEP